jgi:hypothetical protein
MSRTPDPVVQAAALREEGYRLTELEGRTNARLEALALALPPARNTLDVARVAGSTAALAEAEDAVRKLELEHANCSSVLRGIAIRRPLLAQELDALDAKMAVARAQSLAPALQAGELVRDALADAFGDLAELVVEGIQPAIAAAPRDEHRGLVEAASLASLARWIWTEAARAGVDLEQARHVAAPGTDPAATVANLRAVLDRPRLN